MGDEPELAGYMMELEADRTLALHLHSLHEDDAAWILDRIDAESRQRMRVLLDEIKSLGFTADGILLRDMNLSVGARVESADHTDRQTLATIDTASLDVIDRVLAREPVQIKRHIKAANQWCWLREMEQRNTESGTASVGRTDPDVTRKKPTLEVTRSLLKALAAEIAAQAESPLTPGQSYPRHTKSSGSERTHRLTKLARKVLPWRR